MPGGRFTHWDAGEAWPFPVAAECSLREPQQVCDFLEESVVSVVPFQGGTGCGLHRSRKRLHSQGP